VVVLNGASGPVPPAGSLQQRFARLLRDPRRPYENLQTRFDRLNHRLYHLGTRRATIGATRSSGTPAEAQGGVSVRQRLTDLEAHTYGIVDREQLSAIGSSSR